jgi:hypothetical protein
MSDFANDGGQGTVQPVYIAVKGSPLLQIFPTNYTQKDYCTLLGSPSESGTTQYDNKVRQPSTVQFTGIVKSTEKNVFNVFRNSMKKYGLSDILCKFQSKAGQIDNMILESVEEVGESNRYDGIEIRVTLTEFLTHNEKK